MQGQAEQHARALTDGAGSKRDAPCAGNCGFRCVELDGLDRDVAIVSWFERLGTERGQGYTL